MESNADTNGTDSRHHSTSASLIPDPSADAPAQSTRPTENRNTVFQEPRAVLTTFPKRLLPESLSSTYPHGLITGEPRTPAQQEAFESRKAEILRTMSDLQIEEHYQETVKKVNATMREIGEGNEKADREVEAAQKTRETERKAWANLRKAGADG